MHTVRRGLQNIFHIQEFPAQGEFRYFHSFLRDYLSIEIQSLPTGEVQLLSTAGSEARRVLIPSFIPADSLSKLV